MRLFRIFVEFPALDRLVEYLVGREQQGIDNAETQVLSLTERLRKSGLKLDAAKGEFNAR